MMKTQTDTTSSTKSKAVANTASARKDTGQSKVQFDDKRQQSGKIAQLQEMANGSAGLAIQRAMMPEEEEPMQGKFETVQRVEEEELQGKFETVQKMPEEEELLQGKFEPIQRMEEEELMQGKFEPIQRVEEEELVQGKFEPVQKKPNNTGLPDNLKSGMENLSGHSLDDVKVHYNSSKPAAVQAHAYAQGTDIHLGSGQEKHLPHEAWHVVQQKQGRVKPTTQMKGVSVNDDPGLEKEADVMGAKSLAPKR